MKKHPIQAGSPIAKLVNMDKSLNHKNNARGRRRAKRFFKQDYDPKKAAIKKARKGYGGGSLARHDPEEFYRLMGGTHEGE